MDKIIASKLAKKKNITFPPFGGVGGVWDALTGENHPNYGKPK